MGFNLKFRPCIVISRPPTESIYTYTLSPTGQDNTCTFCKWNITHVQPHTRIKIVNQVKKALWKYVQLSVIVLRSNINIHCKSNRMLSVMFYILMQCFQYFYAILVLFQTNNNTLFKMTGIQIKYSQLNSNSLVLKLLEQINWLEYQWQTFIRHKKNKMNVKTCSTESAVFHISSRNFISFSNVCFYNLSFSVFARKILVDWILKFLKNSNLI